MPFFVEAVEPQTTSSFQELGVLIEKELNSDELSDVVGQGIKAPSQEGVEGKNGKIIFWDEARVGYLSLDVSTGHGNLQRNTLSVQGR
jgi:hypothetical protein